MTTQTTPPDTVTVTPPTPHPAPVRRDASSATPPARPVVVADEDLLRLHAELGRLRFDQPLGRYLQHVADLAHQAVPGVDGLSVFVVDGGRLGPAAFVSTAAAMLDERPYGPGSGPCSDAARSGAVQHVDLGRDDGPHRAYVGVARRHGVRAAVALPLAGPDRVVGVLNLFRTTADAVDEPTLASAAAFSAYAADVMANLALHTTGTRLAEQLQEAMRSRALIEQAKGVLMAVHRLDADQAFEHLSRTSQRTNRKLRDVAGDVVGHALAGEPT